MIKKIQMGKLHSNRASAIQADSSNLTDLDKVYSIIKEQNGCLDVVFCQCYGVYESVLLDSVTEQHFDYQRFFRS